MSTLILSGWTQPVNALAHLVEAPVLFDYSEYASPDEAIAALQQISFTHCVAWSMGGQLALRAIAKGALQPRHLTLIAAPLQFVGDAQVKGMDPTTFNLFRESYRTDPARTKTRFHGLVAKGDRDTKRVMGLLSHHPEVENVARWLPWLDALAAYTVDARTLAAAPPTLIVHGTNDAIVPHAQSLALARLLPKATLSSWAEVGHAPHVHDAVRLRREIAEHRALHGVAA